MIVVIHKQLRHVFRVVPGATPVSTHPDYWGGNIRWATPEDIGALSGYWLEDTRRTLTRAGYQSCATTLVPARSIILTKRAPIGGVALLAKEACSNQGCLLLVPRLETDTRFYYFWLSSQVNHLQTLGSGSTFTELSASDLKALYLPHPSIREQRAISDYLDGEVAKIDALLSAKKELLDLLGERRDAFITRAVTRGLDTTASFKDSGLPWLGLVPRNWTARTGRWLFEERDERSETGQGELLTVSHLTGVTPRSEKNVHMFEATTTKGYKICRAGDLVVNTLWAWMGAMGVAYDDGVVSPAYNVYSPGQQLDPGYLDALVRSSTFAQEVGRHSKGVWSSRNASLSRGVLRDLVPCATVDGAACNCRSSEGRDTRTG